MENSDTEPVTYRFVLFGYVIEERKPPRFTFSKDKPAISPEDLSEFEISIEPVYVHVALLRAAVPREEI